MFIGHVIPEVEKLGATITLDGAGENLVIEPGSVLTPELTAELRRCKPYLIQIIARRELPPDPRPPIRDVGEVLELAREKFGPVEEPVILPAPPGRDPMVKRGTDKVRFFVGDWRVAWPPDYRVHRDGGEP